MSPSIQTAPGLGRRMMCMIYEGLLLFGIAFFADLLFDVLTQSRHALKLRHAREIMLFFVIGIYFVYFWSRTGQTLAMKTWRIGVVDLDNGKLPVVKAIVRYCLAWMWFLPAIVLSYEFGLKEWYMMLALLIGVAAWAMTMYRTPDRQFLHDYFAKTKLIQMDGIKND